VRVAYSVPEGHKLVPKVCTHAADLAWNETTLYRGDWNLAYRVDSIQARDPLTNRNSMVSKS